MSVKYTPHDEWDGTDEVLKEEIRSIIEWVNLIIMCRVSMSPDAIYSEWHRFKFLMTEWNNKAYGGMSFGL